MTDSLTEEKKIECKEVFDLSDIDKVGTISTNNLGDVMRALGANPSEAELKEMIHEVDPGKTQKIDFATFLELFDRRMKDPDTEEDLLESFKIFDKEGNGIITVQELKHLVSHFGETLSEEEADELIREADIDGDGTVNIYKFSKKLMGK